MKSTPSRLQNNLHFIFDSGLEGHLIGQATLKSSQKSGSAWHEGQSR